MLSIWLVARTRLCTFQNQPAHIAFGICIRILNKRVEVNRHLRVLSDPILHGLAGPHLLATDQQMHLKAAKQPDRQQTSPVTPISLSHLKVILAALTCFPYFVR